MASARPLRDVFADLIGGENAPSDPDALLRDQGHPELPDHLVAEAVVSYADTAPAEVAEHLAPYVTAHSAVGADEMSGDEPPAGWLDLLGTAPAGVGLADQPADIDDLAPAPHDSDTADSSDGFDGAGGFDGVGLDFGTGADPELATETELPADAGPEDSGDAVEAPADGESAELLTDPADLVDAGDAAGWVAADADLDADETADPSTVDDEEPDGEPLG